MKLVIAGSRTANLVNIELPICEILSLFDINVSQVSEVVSGGANGADKLGEMFSKFFGIEVKQFLPDYENATNKKLAPLERNTSMAKYGDVLLLIWDGKSTGSLDMKQKMEAEGKTVHTYNFNPEVVEYDFNQKLSTHMVIAEAKCEDASLIFPTPLEVETLKKKASVGSGKTRRKTAPKKKEQVEG